MVRPTPLPRVVIAAPASGQGKTTIAVGIMAALSRAGHAVAPAKVGPDYIDPGYHALATGRPGRNLDPWLTSEELIVPLLLHGARTPDPADVAVIEGVMGLFDGRIGTGGFASTAHLATLTRSPVILVADISSAARTIAATLHGLRTFDPGVDVVGVILNKAGSVRHAHEVRSSVEAIGLPVLGVLPRDAGVSAPSRHLGLIPAAERTDAVSALDRLAEQTAELIDLDLLLHLAGCAPDLSATPWSPPSRRAEGVATHDSATTRPVVAVAGGRSFTFRYAETDELLRANGCEPVLFDPALDTSLPPGTSGLYLGGGFPEAHAPALSRNTALTGAVRDAIASGMPTVAECAGLLYLCETLDGHDFVGAVPAQAAMHPRLTLQYRSARTTVDSILGPAGTTSRGHEFHRTRTSPGAGTTAAWEHEEGVEGFTLDPASTGRATLHASYLHTHWAGNPSVPAAFAAAVQSYAAQPPVLGATSTVLPRVERAPALPTTTDPTPSAGLDHHGDAEVGPGLVDFAVNVRVPTPPAWLATTLRDGIGDLAAYPVVDPARTALARRHAVPEDMVLPTSGGAEAFTLIARAIPGRRPLVVHPQFTEPESALRRAGRVPDQHVLSEREGFVLHPDRIPADADLVIIGNPTNPTGVLHPRSTLEALRAPGRVLVIDEAFMDAIVGGADSLISADLDGVIVVRSLTKTWGLAGLRAGYVVGDPSLLRLLAEQQPHWSVSSLAARASVAVCAPAARAEEAELAREAATWRHHLVRGLQSLGLAPVPGAAPFVLVRVGPGVHGSLRERGYAVRRGDSFPGLDHDWVRLAVRDPHTTDGLLRELQSLLGDTAPGGSERSVERAAPASTNAPQRAPVPTAQADRELSA